MEECPTYSELKKFALHSRRLHFEVVAGITTHAADCQECLATIKEIRLAADRPAAESA